MRCRRGFDWLRLGITAGRVLLICVYGVVCAGVVALVLLLGSMPAHAGAIPLYAPSTVAVSASSASGFVTTASATSWSGAAFNSAFTTQVAGKAVTVPAAWRLASNAGQIAVNALRINPAGLAASVAASWLLGYGIQYVSNQWMAQATPDAGDPSNGTKYWYQNYGGACWGSTTGNCGWQQAHDALVAQYKLQNPTYTIFGWENLQVFGGGTSASHQLRVKDCCNQVLVTFSFSAYGSRPLGTQPATDSDWAKVDPATIPDAVLNNLAKDGVFLGVSPTVNTARQGITLGAPYIDPVTGRSMVDMAYVTPAADGKTADLQLARQQVDANGNPATDASGAVVAPVKQDDPCVGNPTRLGCMTSGDVPQGPDLQQSSKTISITPDSGWGPDSMACPADVVVPLHGGGGSAVFSYRPACDFADGARPVVIAFAWVAAVLIALGVGNRGGE